LIVELDGAAFVEAADAVLAGAIEERAGVLLELIEVGGGVAGFADVILSGAEEGEVFEREAVFLDAAADIAVIGGFFSRIEEAEALLEEVLGIRGDVEDPKMEAAAGGLRADFGVEEGEVLLEEGGGVAVDALEELVHEFPGILGRIPEEAGDDPGLEPSHFSAAAFRISALHEEAPDAHLAVEGDIGAELV
jgi:hypothetical protein